MAIRVPPGGSSLGSFLFTTSALAFGGPRSQIFNGWAPDVALDIDFTTGTLDLRITFARASTATYYNSSGVLTSAASGSPRFDYDPVTHVARGLLLEDQKINYVAASEEFDDSSWTKQGTTVTTNQIAAPDGNVTADLVTATVASDAIVYRTMVLGTDDYTTSIYVKKGTANWVYIRTQGTEGLAWAWFDTNSGIVGSKDAAIASTTIQNIGNGWYRLTATRNYTPGYCVIGISNADNTVAATIGNTAYFWGGQTVPGTIATSYIPTTPAATVARAADTASMTGANFSSWFNNTEGTFLVSLDFAGLTASYHFLNVFQVALATQNRMVLYGDATNFSDYINEFSSGTTKNAAIITAAAGLSKLALAYKANDAASAANGTAGATDTSVTIPPVDSLNLGRSEVGASLAPGWYKRLTFYATRKSNSELAALTAPDLIISIGTGTLTAQSAVAASTTGVSGSLITDTTLNADAAVVSSTTGVSGSTITDTTLNASSAVLSSTTGISGSLITDTTLNASAAVLSSTTGLIRAIANPSALTAQAATVIGLGTGAGAAVIGAGALSSSPATLTSTGLARTIGSGALIDGSATLSALAVSGSTGIGELDATTADVEGLGYVEQGGVSIMVGGEWQRTTPYVRVGGTWKPATAWANVNGAWKRVA